MSSGWNIGEKQRTVNSREYEYAVLVGVIKRDQTEEQLTEYLDELEFLALTAGAKTVKRFVQKREHPNKTTLIGKGKVEEIAEYIASHEDISMVLFDDDLSAMQTNNLEEKFAVKIIDRSSLILDIFARRAQTAQAKTQVELAQLQYLLPRLRGLWTHLERQRGGIGMRGPGEKEIETDRRIVRDKISKLKDRLDKIDRQSQTRRKNRGAQIRVGLVGYTNAGKSTLMNLLSKSDVFAEDKLFATLDTTTRKVVLDRMPFLLSDTVGFIRKLPHHLVESFKSTLDEVKESDLLLHVVDLSHPQYQDHVDTVNRTLKNLGATDIETIMVYNKLDSYRERYFDALIPAEDKEQIMGELNQKLGEAHDGETILISAKAGDNITELRSLLKAKVSELYMKRYPYMTKQW